MKISLTSIVFSLVCLVIAVKINYNMSVEYQLVDGKTQALFGIQHLDRFYYGILGFMGLLFAIYAIRKKENRGIVIIALLLSIISMVMTYVELWKYLI